MRDFSRDIKAEQALAPAIRVGSATGGGVDRLGFEALTFAIHAGDWTDGTHTVSADHSDDGTTWESIPADQIIGAFPVVSAVGAENTITMVGYIGDRRYVRAKSTVTGSPVTGAAIGISVLLGRAHSRPVAA
ncbi:MAG TPA: hypothetical protein ENH55_12145 [Aurantimonas coralicida]|uniref:Uncharacterized protein n=2 Tax=root TaxID=1 RepID=A0A9C9NIT5_9HYPH|nr:hypothetical protein [Aurantimonas coralicida]HEU02616.1 hypothetical protein [Aurantimonas coralicida]